MSLPHVVFLDRATIPEHIDIPRPTFEHQWSEFDVTQPEQVESRIKNADIVITNKVVLGADLLSRLPKLKLIAVAATGYNNVDVCACQQQGIAVANVRGYATQSVPEHVIGMVYALRRNLFAYHQDIEGGEWQRNKQFCFFSHPIGDIAGSVMGVVGSGALGQATARLAKAIGMKVIFAERKGSQHCRQGYLPFEDVLRQADVVTLHCPLTTDTVDLISTKELEMMKKSAILVNTGRGGLVNEDALVHALIGGRIAAAGVDVFKEEPADKHNPLIANMDLPNLLLTPHVAWGSDSAIQSLCQILMENVCAFVEGREQNRVV